jgi:hypothetical protein
LYGGVSGALALSSGVATMGVGATGLVTGQDVSAAGPALVYGGGVGPMFFGTAGAMVAGEAGWMWGSLVGAGGEAAIGLVRMGVGALMARRGGGQSFTEAERLSVGAMLNTVDPDVVAARGARAAAAAESAKGAVEAAAPAIEETVVLYHGSKSFAGNVFDVGTATRLSGKTGASFTPKPGIYLTDDFTRAATGYGRGGHVARVEVPRSFAESIKQMGGPAGNQVEYFVNTEAAAAVLNRSVRVLPTREATVQFFNRLF